MKIQMLNREFEMLMMREEEFVVDFTAKLTKLVAHTQSLDEKIAEKVL